MEQPHKDPKPNPQTREALLRELQSKPQRAELQIDRAAVNVDARTASVAFASDTPYERYWGVEILDMSPKSVRMQRLRNNAAALLNHDPSQQIGVVENPRLGPDKKGRADIRFSRSTLGQEILQDVADGIRSKISVGYMVHDLVLERQQDDVSTYRVIDWEPYEISIVSVPADDTVGVGRSVSGTNRERQEMTTEVPAVTAAPADGNTGVVRNMQAGNEAARADERAKMAERTAQILALGDHWKEYGGDQLAKEAITNPQMTVESFRQAMLELLGQKHKPTVTGQVTEAERNQGGDGVAYGMSPREIQASYSLKAFKGVGALHGKKDHEVAYRAGMWAMATIFGDPRAFRWCKDHSVELFQGQADRLGFTGQRDLSEGIFTSAGWLIPHEMESAIIANREAFGVMRSICRIIPMSTASHSIPRVTADSSAYFVGEGTSGTTTDPAGDQVTLSLKDLMARTNIGKSTAADSVVSLADFVAQEQARAFAIKEDDCFILGDGTSTYGGIQGLITLLQDSNYSGGRAVATTGHNLLTEVDNTDVSNCVGLLPIYSRMGAMWLASGVAEGIIFGRLRLTAGGNDTGTVNNQIITRPYAGFPVALAPHMPAGASTDYVNKIMVILGNFTLGVAVGTGQGMMMTVDPYTNADKNQIRIITTERIDIVCHGVNRSTTVPGPIVGIYGA